MTKHILSVPVALAVLGLPMSAGIGDDLRVSMKMGITPVVGGTGTQHVRGALLLGVDVAYPLWRGQAFVGLDYRLYRAEENEETRFGVGYAPDGTVGTIRFLNPDESMLADRESVDFRKNLLQGYSITLGYRMPVLVENLYFQGGLTLGLLRSEQYVTGVINVLANEAFTCYDPSGNVIDTLDASGNPVHRVDPSGNHVTGNRGDVLMYRDSMRPNIPNADGTLTTTAAPLARATEDMYYEFHAPVKIKPGLFVGLRYHMNDNLFSEVNLCTVSYNEVNYVPGAYSGKTWHAPYYPAYVQGATNETALRNQAFPYTPNPKETLEFKTRTKVQLEFNFGLRF